MIISPEFRERIDLNQLTRELMSRMEKYLVTPLDWVAVPHFNTEHLHVPDPGRWRRKALETCSSLIPPSSALELGVQIREVTLAGLIYIVAGTGAPDFSGDGGPETSATINISAIAVDGWGTGLSPSQACRAFARSPPTESSTRLRASECVLTTISWPGSAFRYSGDGGPATDGRFFQRCRGPGG
jgi:hypothetical protein